MNIQEKPGWITDKQWEANPNIYHWEQSQKAMQSKKQSKNPLTREQLEEQIRKRAISLGQNPNDYDNLLNEEIVMET